MVERRSCHVLMNMDCVLCVVARIIHVRLPSSVAGINVVVFNKRLGYLDPDINEYPEKLQAIEDIKRILRLFVDSTNYPDFMLKYFPLKITKDYSESFTRFAR